MSARLRLRDPVPDKVQLSRFERAPDATIEQSGAGLSIVTSGAHRSFAAAIPLTAHQPSDPSSAVVEIDANVVDNAVTFIFATPDMRETVGGTGTLEPGHTGPLRWAIQGFERARWLIVRNDGVDGRPASLRLGAVNILPMESESLPEIADLAEGRLGTVDLAGMAAIAQAIENPKSALVMGPPLTIDAVPVELLGQRLGYSTGFDPAHASRKKLTEWRMEDDDQPIFRYLYREAKPARHLEFGTWQGAGAVYCLEECDATVWTINLLEGERRADGKVAYDGGASKVESEKAATDSGAMIGHLYREGGFGHRVCQIYSDSRLWDTRNYPPGFFDSILIDGGHQADVVLSDTMKAIELLRPGGLCLWHDFAPDPAVFGVSPATIGVAQGIHAAWPAISESMRDIFYVWPSQILVGVRR